MKRYLFCHALPHINYLKTSGNNISKLFLTLRRHENNEKLKLPSTIKTRAHPLLVTFDVLRLHVVTEKNQFRCAIFRILIYSNPKILQISFLKPFLASVIKFFSSYKKFRRAVFKRRSCNSKNFWFFSPHISKTTSFDSKKHFYWGISTTSIHLFFYSRFSYPTKHVVYMRQRNLHKQPVYKLNDYFCHIAIFFEMLLKLSKN